MTFAAALLLARRYRSSEAGWGEALREVVTGRSTVLLVAGLVIGLGTGASGYASVEPFFGGIFSGVLTLFLLEMGVVAGRRLRDVRQAGLDLVAFGVLMPVRSGWAGVLTGQAVGLSPRCRGARLGVLERDFSPHYAVVAFAHPVAVLRGEKYDV